MTRNRLWVKWKKGCLDHPLRVLKFSLLTQVDLPLLLYYLNKTLPQPVGSTGPQNAKYLLPDK